jgi:DNA replication protein DnaC
MVANSFRILRARRQDAGRKKSLFSVPYLPNPDFVGRQDILDEIRRRLAWREDHSQARVALCGLGGVGKTQIAIRYAYSVQKRYAMEGISVFWIHGASRETFDASYRDLAKQANVPNNPTGVECMP